MVCVAKILAENSDEAMRKAVAIAVSDGLYSTEVTRIDDDDSGLEVELLGTFTKGIQEKREWVRVNLELYIEGEWGPNST